eukprot:6192372-Pleurochrysis_carterae.AAC.3
MLLTPAFAPSAATQENRAGFVKSPGKYQLVETEEGGDEGDDATGLGKLSRAQIEKGQAVLAKIKAAMCSKKKARQTPLRARAGVPLPPPSTPPIHPLPTSVARCAPRFVKRVQT